MPNLEKLVSAAGSSVAVYDIIQQVTIVTVVKGDVWGTVTISINGTFNLYTLSPVFPAICPPLNHVYSTRTPTTDP